MAEQPTIVTVNGETLSSAIAAAMQQSQRAAGGSSGSTSASTEPRPLPGPSRPIEDSLQYE